MQDSNWGDKILVLTGPTGSGKSGLALNLARKLGGQVISADSMQVYRYLDVGTAKLMPESRWGVKHYLLDQVDPDQDFSLADWLRIAKEAIETIRSQGCLPIVCGGTGLYIDFLIEGLSLADPADQVDNQDLRAKLQAEFAATGWEKAHARLSDLDPEAGKLIKLNDQKRIVRFFERLELTGLTLSQHNIQSKLKAEQIGDFKAYYLNPDRSELYAKINARSDRIFAGGLIEEFKRLDLIYPNFRHTQAYQAIAYKEAEKLILGQETRAEAVSRLAQSTRNYAKRQLSWFRRKDYYQALNPESAEATILKDFLGV